MGHFTFIKDNMFYSLKQCKSAFGNWVRCMDKFYVFEI